MTTTTERGAVMPPEQRFVRIPVTLIVEVEALRKLVMPVVHDPAPPPTLDERSINGTKL